MRQTEHPNGEREGPGVERMGWTSATTMVPMKRSWYTR